MIVGADRVQSESSVWEGCVTALAPVLPETTSREQLSRAVTLDDVRSKGEVLSALAPRLSSNDLVDTLRAWACGDWTHEHEIGDVLEAGAPALDEEACRALVGEIVEIHGTTEWTARLLLALADRLPSQESRLITQDVLAAALSFDGARTEDGFDFDIGIDFDRISGGYYARTARLLARLAHVPVLSTEERQRASAEAFRRGRLLLDPAVRVAVFAAVADVAPASLRAELVDETEGLLRGLLPPTTPRRANGSQVSPEHFDVVRAGFELVRALDGEGRDRLLRSLERVVHAERCPRQLLGLADWRQGEKRRAAVEDVMALIRRRYPADQRLWTEFLSAAAAELSRESMAVALDIATELGDRGYTPTGGDMMSALAPHLPRDLLPRAVEIAAARKDSSARAAALSAIAQRLSPAEAEEVADRVSAINDADLRTHAILRFAAALGGVVIRGEPGIGKTAIAATLIARRAYVHHFNIAPENIRSAKQFLENVCAQLILRFELSHATLPPHASDDSGFLSQLLSEAAARGPQPIVVVVDALDEVEHNDLTAANRLYLPRTLPPGVFFVLTTREEADYNLDVDNEAEIWIREDDPSNRADVACYIEAFVDQHASAMEPRLAEWGIERAKFVEDIAELSEGNFMYLFHVLPDIARGRLTQDTVGAISALPRGLTRYYQRHWRDMKDTDPNRFSKLQRPVLCFLAISREPVTLQQLMQWTRIEPGELMDVIRDWREFLNEDSARYRIYHRSFAEFLDEQENLRYYHDQIAQSALAKIPGFL